MYTTPLSGMLAAEGRVEKSASRIARLPASVVGDDSLDLSAEMIALLKARNDFAANVKAQQVMDETAQSTLSLVG
jgi:hypothetical protein